MLSFISILFISTASSQRIKMNTDNRMFQDPLGRTAIFHGVNVVVKIPPYIPNTDTFDPQFSLSAQDIQNLTQWGFNFVRLGVMWEAVETSQNSYNLTYLDQIETLINNLGQAGIWTLVDNHQDVYARKICGEGVPDFYAKNLSDECGGTFGPVLESLGACVPFSSFNYSYDANGDPLISNCTSKMFALYYATPEAADGFARIYTDEFDYQKQFIQFWNVTSAKFAGNPYVIGYDLLNEPLAANMVTSPWTAIPGVNDYIHLQGLYENTNEVLRQNDDEAIIFFEPIQGDLIPLLGGMVMPVGFQGTPGGQSYLDRVVLNDHSYCCQMSTKACSIGEPPIQIAPQCADFNYARVKSRSLDAEDLGVGLMITEFGACFNTENCVAEIEGVTNACDDSMVGWAYWMFKEFGDFTTSGQSDLTGGEGFYVNNSLQTGKVKALARTYIQFYQGLPYGIQFNSSTGYFQANFTLLLNVGGPTVLFASKEFYYPNGVNINIVGQPAVESNITSTGNYYYISFIKPGRSSEITITVTPK